MERTPNDQLEVRFYLFHDDFKQALYSNPYAPDIDPKDAQGYIAENTKLQLNGQAAQLQFQRLDFHQDQVRLIYQIHIDPNQKIENIELTNHLLIKDFRTQVNMVYFVKSNGERLVRMLDASSVEAKFDGLNG